MKNKLLLAFLFLPLLASAQTYTYSTLLNFPPQVKRGPNDPFGSLIIDAAGNLYGTTLYGGANGPSYGDGTVFKVTPKGTLSVLHSFDGTDGEQPWTNVVRDAEGNLYGTTFYGGAYGMGTVFKLTPGGQETVLHDFAGGADGNNPLNAVTLDARGNLYGYTFCTGDNCGGVNSIYKITKQGVFSIVFNFNTAGGLYGSNPVGSLIVGKDGNFYGATKDGGSTTLLVAGVVFKLTPSGVLSVLHVFPYNSSTDLEYPGGKLTQDADGNMFGGAALGLDASGIFKITTLGEESVLTFCCSGSESMVRDPEGNLYGILGFTSTSNDYSIYKVTPSGAVATLYTFPDGVYSSGGLAIDKAGNLYGTTSQGGTNSTGTVFKLTKAD